MYCCRKNSISVVLASLARWPTHSAAYGSSSGKRGRRRRRRRRRRKYCQLQPLL